jgi:hypothetical protein
LLFLYAICWLINVVFLVGLGSWGAGRGGAAGPAPAPPPPLPSVSDAVPIAMPAPDPSAQTVVRTARVSWDTEPTAISPPPSETRVPGAAFTLPANPLGDLDAADLGSFVELTLLESDGAGRLAARFDRARRIAPRVVGLALCLLGGLLLGIALR